MPCYLCVYQRTERPDVVHPLPRGAAPMYRSWSLGTCHRCGVWTCFRHGTRYIDFECAICRPATAVKDALSAGPNGPAAEEMRTVGLEASETQREIVRAGVERVVADHTRARGGLKSMRFAADDDNVVTGLADIVRGHTESRQFLAGAAPEGGREEIGGVSIDAIGAAARRVLDALELDADPHGYDIDAITGALLVAVAVANQPSAEERGGEQHGVAPTEIEIPPPWTLRLPGLLDPALWPFATAMFLQR